MDWEEKKYWIGLNMVDGVGKTTFYRLIRALGSPQAVFSASHSDLVQVDFVGKKTADQILNFDFERNVEWEIRRVQSKGVDVVTRDCPNYPKLLHEIYDPPPVLYCIGKNIGEISLPLAVVGTRMASNYGKNITKILCKELASYGFCIVSGMARGIDSIAHQSALEASGNTIAVLGCGLEYTYPPENRTLKNRIVENGTVISEFPMMTGPDRGNFPARNRIISGLSIGTLIIEAGHKSGALITGQFALEQGREVFAVPGNINSRNSWGTNRIIKLGAKLVDGVDSIIEELPLHFREQLSNPKNDKIEKKDLSSNEKHLISLMSDGECHIDDLIQNSNLSPAEVSATLIQLELKGFIQQAEGKMFSTS